LGRGCLGDTTDESGREGMSDYNLHGLV
jgi:hypothetical protein